MRDRGKTLEMYGGEELGSHCRKHPSQASGGICALCLKDRLSKLVCSDCGEQRPPSCSCSEAASSSSNNVNNKDTTKAGTVDVGSAGRISFLIESDNVVDLNTEGNGEGVLVGAEQFQCDVKSKPAKPDAIVLLKRSKSVACTTASAKTTPSATPPPSMVPPSLPLPTGTVGDSKVCASDNAIKRPSSFWSFLYFVKSRQTPPKSNTNSTNITSQQSKHKGVGSSHKSSKQEVVHRLQEMHSNRPTKQGLVSRKAREQGLLDFVDEISPRPTKVGLVNGKPTEHRVEDIHTTHAWNVHESPLWILPKLFRSRSVGCGRNSFSVDHDDTSPRRLESGPKSEAKGHMRSYGEEKKSFLTKGKYKQSNHRSPKSPAAASAGYMKIDKDDEQSKARGQSSGKTKGLFGAFGKSGATLYNMSSVESSDVNQTSGANSGKGRGWSWAFSSPARIFRHRKPDKEATNNSSNGFLNHVKSNAAASNSSRAALYGD